MRRHLHVIATAIALSACGSEAAPGSSASATATAAPASRTSASANAALVIDGKAELRDLQVYPTGPAKAHYFVGEMVVASGRAVRDPMFRVVVKDESGATLDSGSCAYRGVIKASQRVPCFGAIWKASKWAKVDVTFVPGDSTLAGDPAPLTVSGAALTHGTEVDGTITNGGTEALKDVTAFVSLYGADGKIVGGNSGVVVGGDLAPGASAKFSVVVDQVASAAKTFAVETSP